MKITNYTQATVFDDGDFLIKDGNGGTKIIKATDAVIDMLEKVLHASMHANIFRGTNLGTSVTAEQKAAVQNGTFKGLYIGDYWVIGGVIWRIADIDYFYNCGDTAFTKHHLLIVPDSNLYNAQMNTTNTTVGGYVGSAMYTDNLEQAKTKVQEAFGELVLTHRDYFTNAVTNGLPTGGAWYDSKVELMNEIMVYGCPIRMAMNNGSNNPSLGTTAKKQLSLFRLNPTILNKRAYFWLRDVVSSADFAHVYLNGYASSCDARYSYGVRPYFCIG